MSRAASPRFAQPGTGTPRLPQRERLGHHLPVFLGPQPPSDPASSQRRPPKELRKPRPPLQERTRYPNRSPRKQVTYPVKVDLQAKYYQAKGADMEKMQQMFKNSQAWRGETATPDSARQSSSGGLSQMSSLASAYYLSASDRSSERYIAPYLDLRAELDDVDHTGVSYNGVNSTSEQKVERQMTPRQVAPRPRSQGHFPVQSVRPNRSILAHDAPNPFIHEKLDDGDFTKVTDTDFNATRARKELNLSKRLYRFLRENNAEGNGTGLWASVISHNDPEHSPEH
mmetsp:Transcript_17191/g.30139  ORF Transcript_17191/g.30139 Transcript_17191/m.30139 type:complete len:284 (-) Transcript_17191:80-931(-)